MTRTQMEEKLRRAGMDEKVIASALEATFGKTVKFTRTDGTVRNVSEGQARAWEKFRANAPERKERFEQMKADWDAKRKAFEPSKELIEAIKANRASITRKIAKERFGFVGTKEDLKALKDEICGK